LWSFPCSNRFSWTRRTTYCTVQHVSCILTLSITVHQIQQSGLAVLSNFAASFNNSQLATNVTTWVDTSRFHARKSHLHREGGRDSNNHFSKTNTRQSMSGITKPPLPPWQPCPIVWFAQAGVRQQPALNIALQAQIIYYASYFLLRQAISFNSPV